ncbi:hypothetical protein RHGRI_018628 [Rhododendron griersonianum]|uniref:Uncharacterized protein n=1 Tax=Rhododendron griersonianum TaxID=479676 RepID=A0AAV6K242_9ERIC|nr:hypothetical protein RHGRI_018628 [Rhododendron griersonianum]
MTNSKPYPFLSLSLSLTHTHTHTHTDPHAPKSYPSAAAAEEKMKKMRWWWNWWRGKLTRTAMEKLKPWDAEEIRRRERLAHSKCHEELNKVDWEMMKKHLHTPEALQAYEKLCNEARECITVRVTSVIHRRRPDVRMQYHYGTFAYLPFKERVLLKWADGMKLLQKRYPLGMKLLQKMLPGKKEEK